MTYQSTTSDKFIVIEGFETMRLLVPQFSIAKHPATVTEAPMPMGLTHFENPKSFGIAWITIQEPCAGCISDSLLRLLTGQVPFNAKVYGDTSVDVPEIKNATLYLESENSQLQDRGRVLKFTGRLDFE